MQHSYQGKSQDTYNSGEMLRSNNLHNSSIHCYYYACVQLCNHVFVKTENLTDDQIRSTFKKLGSHHQTINKIVSKVGLSSRKTLTVNLSTLKDKRQLADYRMFSLDKDDSQDAKDLCDDILGCLNKLL